MKFWRNKKIILGILVSAIFVLIFPKSADAGAPAVAAAIFGALKGIAITAGEVYLVVLAVHYIGIYIAGHIFSLGGWLVDLALQMNSLIMQSPVLLIGWKIILSFTNLGFVLAIIVIAFATIFRIQSYAMKQTLWKLIVAALLVNFSLVIAGAFINVADIITQYLLVNITDNPKAFAKSLSAAMDPQKFLKVRIAEGFWNKLAEEIKGIFSPAGLLKSIASVFFILIFTLFGALTFIALAAMLLFRYVALIILLILSPIVWLFWIFPATSGQWKRWWTQFIRWTFFAPAVIFFLYLTVATMDAYKAQILTTADQLLTGAPQDVISKDYTLTENVPAVIGQMVVLLALMLGGLYAANSLGITFADTFYNVAKGAAQGAAKGMGRGIVTLPGRAGARILRTKNLGNKIAGGLNTAGTTLQGKTGWYHLPTRLLGKGLVGIAGQTRKATTYRGKNIWTSTLGGLKAGSGLFQKKKKGVKDWECQVCFDIIRRTSKPTIPCSVCGNINWAEA